MRFEGLDASLHSRPLPAREGVRGAGSLLKMPGPEGLDYLRSPAAWADRLARLTAVRRPTFSAVFVVPATQERGAQRRVFIVQ